MVECKWEQPLEACKWCEKFNKTECVLLKIPNIKNIIDSLESEKAEIETISHFKGEFLANISHEIKTPMNAILGMSYLLAKANPNAEQKNYIEKITASANTLLGILNDILDMAKIESGKMQLSQSPVDIRKLIDEVISIVRFALEEKNLRLFVHLSSKIPDIISSDEVRLKQILLNLLNNAIKFTDRGEIIVIGELNNNKQIIFTIKDSGIGIKDEDKIKLFKPFVQADSTFKKRYQGSGLGLSICKNLVGLMGGELWFESQFSKGSEFSFSIPLLNFKIKSEKPVSSKLTFYFIEENLRIYEGLKTWAGDSDLNIKVCKSLTDFALQLDENPAYLFLTRSYLMNASDNYLLLDLKRNLKLEKVQTCILTQFLEKYPIAADFANIIDFHFTIPLQTWLLERLALKLEQGGELDFRDVPPQNIKSETKKLENICILVVEDNVVNQMVINDILTKKGAKVSVAESGDEALRIVSAGEKKFDVILMDIQMPNMDGYETARKMKKIPWVSNVPIIAMTAHSREEISDHFLDAGMMDFLPKPVEPDHMVQVIQKHSRNQFKEFCETLGAQNRFSFDEPIDWVLARQNVGNNESLLSTVINRFRADYGAIPNFMSKNFFSGDMTQFERNINSLKAKSCYLGASRLRGCVEQLEKIFKETSRDREKNITLPLDKVRLSETSREQLYKAIADVDKEIRNTCDEIEKYMRVSGQTINYDFL